MKKRFIMFTAIATLSMTMVACGSDNTSASLSGVGSASKAEVTQAEVLEATTTEILVTTATGKAELIPPAVEMPPIETVVPTSDNKWSGGYDNLVGDGYDHIKVPTLDSFNNNSFDEEMKDEAFNADSMPSDWADAWWNAYDDFLVANGSPVTEDGEVLGAFMSINPGWKNNYQYLYYGVNFSGDTNGWGDLNLYPASSYSGWNIGEAVNLNPEDFKDAYFFEIANFTYGYIDETLTKDYRSATTMLLSWVCPNPAEVEKTIYEAFISDSAFYRHFEENGHYSWFQVGDVDMCFMGIDSNSQVYVLAIREHR